MRQLKAFMKAKKGVCSNKCECLTINMWRCADLQNGEEFCGCGESETSVVGNKIYVVKSDTQTQELEAKIFVSGNNYILYKVEGGETSITLKGAFDSEGGNALLEIISGNMALFIIGKGGTFPSAGITGEIDDDVVALINNLIEDPSNENKQALSAAIARAVLEFVTFVTYPVPIDIVAKDWIGLGAKFVKNLIGERWEEQMELVTYTINGREYYDIEPTSDSSAYFYVNLAGHVYYGALSVETEEETGISHVVIPEFKIINN